MEDVTDPAFRALCKRYGADRVYTEFVNADALVMDDMTESRLFHCDGCGVEQRGLMLSLQGKKTSQQGGKHKVSFHFVLGFHNHCVRLFYHEFFTLIANGQGVDAVGKG